MILYLDKEKLLKMVSKELASLPEISRMKLVSQFYHSSHDSLNTKYQSFGRSPIITAMSLLQD
jgi:hypothetical protein